MLNDHEPGYLPQQPGDGRIKLDIAQLKQQRKHLGMSQEALALHSFELKIYLSVASIKRAESGKAVLYRTAKQFARLFNLPVQELVNIRAGASGMVWPDSLVATTPVAVNLNHVPSYLSADDSRRIICLTLEMEPSGWDALWTELQASFGLTRLPCELIKTAKQVHLLFGSKIASQHDIFYGFRYAWALYDALLKAGRPVRVMLQSALWQPSTRKIVFQLIPPHSMAEADGQVIEPVLWIARGLQGDLQHQACLEEADQHYDYLRFNRLTQHCQTCRSFWQLNSVSSCNECLGQLTLYGRDRELLLLNTAIQDVVQDQLATILYIRGVAGVGKSRLIEEGITLARQQQLGCHHAWLSDSRHELQESLLSQLVFSALKIHVAQRHAIELVSRRLESLSLSALQQTALLLLMKLPLANDNPLYTALAATARERLKLEAVAAVIIQLSMTQPLMLVIEDVHWASQLDLQSLGQLLQMTQEAPIIWLISSRHEQDPLEQHLRHSIVDLSFILLDLSPLRPTDALQLAGQFLKVDPDYRERCIAHAKGNPLFLTQLLRSTQKDQLPATLAHLIQAKLDQLLALDRQVLRYASVAGRQVSLPQILAVLGADSYSFETLVKHYFMRAAGDDYVFVHHLIAMSIYDAMDSSLCMQLHLDWAQYHQGNDAATSALHFQKADDPRAIVQYLLAIQAHHERLDYQAAHQLIEQCKLIGQHHFNIDNHYQLSHLAAITANKLGHTHQARHYYEQAMQNAGNPRKKLTAAIGLIRTLNILEAREAEKALLEQVMPEALAQQDTEVLAQLYNIKANLSFFLGQINDCKTFHNQAIHYAEITNLQEIRVRSYGGLGDASYAQGHMQTAREYLERSIILAREHQLLEIETANLFMLATLKIYANDTLAALNDALTAAELSKRVGNRRAEVVSRLTAGWVLISLGDYDQAQTQVSQGLALACSMGAFRFEAFLLESQARLAWITGHMQDAQHYIDQAWQLVQQHQCHAFIGPWILATQVLLGTEPASPSVQQALTAAQAILAKGCVGHNYYRFYVSVAEYWLIQSDPAQARICAEKLRHYTAGQPCAWSNHLIKLIEAYADWLDAPQDISRQATWHSCFKQGISLGLTGVMPRLLQVYQHQTVI